MISAKELEALKIWGEDNITIVLSALNVDFVDKGKYLIGTCPSPFHPGDANNKTAFSWSTVLNKWGCWTHFCHRETSTNIFGLIMAVQELNFGASLYWLRELKNSPDLHTQKTVVRSKATSQLFINSKINECKLSLLYDDFYFQERGITKEVLVKHKVGYWQKNGSFMDKRAIVPIFDEDSNLIGFSGRDVTGLSDKKWVHGKDFVSYSEETLHKSNIVYNFDNVIKLNPLPKEIFIVEGPMDCWKLEMAGINNVVATLGLGLNLTQVNKLVNAGIEKMTICYDNDEHNAGLLAAQTIENSFSEFFQIEIKIPKTAKDYGEMNIEEICKELIK